MLHICIWDGSKVGPNHAGNTLLSRETLPCNPAAEAAFHPLSWGSQSLLSHMTYLSRSYGWLQTRLWLLVRCTALITFYHALLEPDIIQPDSWNTCVSERIHLLEPNRRVTSLRYAPCTMVIRHASCCYVAKYPKLDDATLNFIQWAIAPYRNTMTMHHTADSAASSMLTMLCTMTSYHIGITSPHTTSHHITLHSRTRNTQCRRADACERMHVVPT